MPVPGRQKPTEMPTKCPSSRGCAACRGLPASRHADYLRLLRAWKVASALKNLPMDDGSPNTCCEQVWIRWLGLSTDHVRMTVAISTPPASLYSLSASHSPAAPHPHHPSPSCSRRTSTAPRAAPSKQQSVWRTHPHDRRARFRCGAGIERPPGHQERRPRRSVIVTQKRRAWVDEAIQILYRYGHGSDAGGEPGRSPDGRGRECAEGSMGGPKTQLRACVRSRASLWPWNALRGRP